MTDDIDHLHEAKQHVMATPYCSEHYLLRAQGHALIAIAEELRKQNSTPRTTRYNFNVPNIVSEDDE